MTNSIKEKRSYIKNLLANSLVGYQIHVLKHPNLDKLPLVGIIIDETKSIISIQTDNVVKKIEKLSGYYKITSEKISFRIEGRVIDGTPNIRKKRKYRNW